MATKILTLLPSHCLLLTNDNIYLLPGLFYGRNLALHRHAKKIDAHVWDLTACTVNLQASLSSEYTAAVNRVVWSPDGGLLGVAYSKRAYLFVSWWHLFILCAHTRKRIFSLGSRVDYDAPVRSCTAMAYCADGTSKEGESFIVEWNGSEGAVKRTYNGLGNRSVGLVQFDTMKNKFLLAGDEFQIKFWDMDSVELLTTTPTDGGLPVTVYSDFNWCWSNWP